MTMSEWTDIGRVLPVSLMVDGRPCLVVGGGTVATRKVRSLLDAGAQITVVSPDVSEDVASLAAAGSVRHIEREFEPGDIEGMFLVIVATSDEARNRDVAGLCRAGQILCGIVDKGWRDGDFVSPATLRRDELTVAVSTGGRSCRRSRMIKDSLDRHIDAVSTVDLLVLGTSHECLSIERREPLHLAGPRMAEVAALLAQVWGVHEFALLDTCNRVELHAVVSDQPEAETLLRTVLGFDRLEGGECYSFRGERALRHTAVLLAGLLSQTPGENHIVSQVKEAFAAADRAGWANSMMKEWLASALHISKDIRKGTQPLLRDFEVEDLCLDYLAAEHDGLGQDGFMVLGSGMVGRGVVERFLDRYPQATVAWCYNRNEPDMPAAWRDRVTLSTLNAMQDRLREIHALVCATGSPGHILLREDAPCFDREGEVHVVDLGVPRNVAPELDGISSDIHVADLDDLKHWYRREAADMSEIMDIARSTVDEHRDMYEKLLRGLTGETSATDGTRA